MRTVLLVLFFVLSGAAARAQPVAPAPALSADQEAAIVGFPVLATAGMVALWARTDDARIALALPFVPVAVVCAVGSIGAYGGDCLHAAKTTLQWSMPGLALLGIGAFQGGWDGLGALLLGGGWLVVVPPFAAVEGYRQSLGRHPLTVAPTAVADPATHRLAPGVQVRLGL